MSGRTWLLLGIAAFMVASCVALSLRSALWADEVFSLAMATGHSLEQPARESDPQLGDFVEGERAKPAAEFARYLKSDGIAGLSRRVLRAVFLSDTSPPLYYLLLLGWTLVFGTGDLAVRLFSAACALLCLPFLASVAKYCGGKRTVLLACLLFAFSPITLYFSSEARMYSLLWLCVVANLHATILLHETGTKVGTQVWWVASTFAGFLTHYFFVFPWTVTSLCLLLTPGKAKRLFFMLDGCVAGALLLPWYWKLPHSLAAWRVTKDWLIWQPAYFNRPVAIFRLITQCFSGHSNAVWDVPKIATTIALLSFGVVFAGMVLRFRLRLLRWPFPLVWLAFFAACSGPVIFDLARHTYTTAVPRYALAALPLGYLLAAIGLVTFKVRARTVLLTLIAVCWGMNLWSIYRQTSRIGEPFAEIGQWLTANCDGNSVVVVHSIPSGVLGVARYANPFLLMAPWVGQLQTRHVPESIAALSHGFEDVFLVKVHAVGEAAPEEEWLRLHAQIVKEEQFGLGSVVEYRIDKSNAFESSL